MVPSFRNFVLWVLIFLLVLALVTLFQNPGHRSGSDIAYSQLLNDVEAGRISRIVIPGSGEITATYGDGRIFSTPAPSDPQLAARLQQKGVDHRKTDAARQHAVVRCPARQLVTHPSLHRSVDFPLAADAPVRS